MLSIYTAPRQPGPDIAYVNIQLPMQARQATIPNLRLQADDWLQAASSDADVARQIKQPLLLDVNDPNLTFELRRGADPGTFANAAATILTARPRVSIFGLSTSI